MRIFNFIFSVNLKEFLVEIGPGESCVLIPVTDDPLCPLASFDSRTIDLAGPRNTRYANAHARKYPIGGQGTSVLVFIEVRFTNVWSGRPNKEQEFWEANARRQVHNCSAQGTVVSLFLFIEFRTYVQEAGRSLLRTIVNASICLYTEKKPNLISVLRRKRLIFCMESIVITKPCKGRETSKFVESRKLM